jgi:hypothetical protein
VKINKKDVLDALVLLAEHPLGQNDGALDSRFGLGAINVPRILSFTSNDWGWWRTVTGNLDTLDKYLATEAAPDDLDLNNGASGAVRSERPDRGPAQGDRRRPEVDALEAPARVGEPPDLVPGARGDGTQLMRDLLRHRHPRLGRLLAQVPQRRQVPQGRRPDHGRRHDRQGDGADRRPTARTWELELQGQRHVLTSEDELRAMEKRISDRGYYPVRLTRDEVDAWAPTRPWSTRGSRRRCSPASNAGWRWATSGWPGPTSDASSHPPMTTCSRSTRFIDAAQHVQLGEANTIQLDGFTLVSTGWANPTPEDVPRAARGGAADSDRRPRGRPFRTASGRSSTSTRRRMRRTSTPPRSSMPT